MVGENYDPYQNFDPDYDGAGMEVIDLEELTALLGTLDEPGAGGYPGTEGRQDWALERECEISRLEKENQELRRMLGIDDENMAAHGVTVDLDRIESGRNATFLSSSRRPPSSTSEPYGGRPSYWDNSNQQGVSLQRPMELQPGMRAGQQARRTGIFGGSQQRGGFLGSAGRGLLVGVAGNPVNPSAWGNQPTTPIAPQIDRPWGSSGLDLNR